MNWLRPSALMRPLSEDMNVNEVKPSIDVATKMAEALQVSLDYLVGFADDELDHSLTQKIIDIQKLNDEDKSAILKTIDALLRDAKARKAYAQ